jgi:perosamine synthetase
MINKRILITGGASRFAKKLKKYLFGKNIIYTTRKQLDILDNDSIKNCIDKYKPDYLIHLASLSRPMNIHTKKINLSIDTNIIGTANIVKKCYEKNIKLIFFSSNYVYPGKKGNYMENDGVLPINNYAWSKLGGEASVILYKNSLILRVAMTEKPFVHKEAFIDAKVNFLYQEQVAKIIPQILEQTGILNIGSNYVETIYDFAKKSNKKVKKSSIKNVNNFPKDSSVNIERLEKLIGKPQKCMIKYKLAAGPSITSMEKNIVNDMMENGWDNYDYVEKFEREFADYHGRKFCLMTPSCTLAIYLTLKSLGIKKNDEIIVPDSTWTASVSPIVELGAIPIFVDVNEKNWCIDTNLIEKKITEKTKAILCVDLFGNMPDMTRLLKICKDKKLFFLEDSAEALGSQFQKIKAGKFGDVSFHSFHRTKTITSGEGGALLTDNKKIYNKAKFLRDLGRSKYNTYYAEAASLKFMPSNLQASIAYAQLQRIDELLNIKKKIYKNYKRELYGLKIRFNLENKKIKNGFWATVINFDSTYKINVNSLLKYLSKNNIFARAYFMPLSSQKAYKKFADKQKIKESKISQKLFQNSIVLPSHYNLTAEDIKLISKKIKKFIYGSIS